MKVVAKVGRLLVDHTIRLRLPAFVVGGRVVELAIPANVKRAAAMGTGFLPPDTISDLWNFVAKETLGHFYFKSPSPLFWSGSTQGG